MAIKGKLVPQNPDDEPASVLLERIRAEKQQLIKEGKIKKDKNDSIIYKGDDNRYYENLPCGWSVSTLSQVTSSQLLNDGDWILSENMDPNGNVKLIQLGSIGLMRYIDKGFKYLTEDTFHKLSCTQIFPGYMLINRIISDKMYACILPQLEGKLITTVDTCWIAPKDEWYNLKYLMYFTSSTVFQSIVLHVSSGTTRKRISKSDLIHLPIYLPPLSEQQRIVSRVDELFEQIDIIEKNQADIDALYDEFRKRTLTLAIQGKLVPQDPNDEPANVLLERISAEKKAKLGKKYVDSYIYKGDDNCYYEKVGTNEPVRLDNLPFDIPDSWCWARLGNIGDWGAGATPARTKSQYYGGNIPWLKTGELNNDIVYGSEEHITDEALKECSLRYCRIGDVLIAMYGATIGKLAIAGVPLTTNQACCACTPYEGIYNFYLFYFLMEEKDNFTQMGFGGAQPNISKEKIIKHLFPVPPYEEQKEIVSTFISIQNILKDEN